jgi:drug/metabolite transporter (DMT)-like permease
MVMGMLATGTLNTLTMKIQFTFSSTDSTGDYHLFQKPWWGTLNMLTAMAFVGLVDKLVRMCSGPDMAADAGAEALLAKPGEITFRKKVMLVAYPAAFDLLATAFACIGILYIPASVWQMLRGACLIFSAIFSITFLKRKLMAFHWFGLGICLVGIVSVGYAGVLSTSVSQSASTADDGKSGGMVLFGMGMVLLGQIVQAAQVIAEEWLMKDVDLPPMQIIGWEGIWGSLMMFVIVYPILWLMPGQDHGHQEDLPDTFVMLSNNPQLFVCFMVYLFSCATFNATGIAVTGALSAVHRQMLDASRTTVIWAFGLVVHSYDPTSPFGEQWTVYSPLQLLGFLVLVVGQATYGQVVKWPGFAYPEDVKMVSPKSPASIGALMDLPAAADDVEVSLA